MAWRYFNVGVSLVLVVACIYLWIARGDSKYGVDFRGGAEYVVRFDKDISIDQVRSALAASGFGEALVQSFEGGTREFSIRIGAENATETAKKIRDVLGGIPEHSYQMLQEDFVGPTIGEEIRRYALFATLISLLGILIYVAIRFDIPFALGGVLALFHDPIIAIGATILYGIQLNSHSLAAALTIVGYSINDTIVVYDRIRENLQIGAKSGSAGKSEKAEEIRKMSLADVMNLSINETLSRSVLTHVTVFFVTVALWLVGKGSVSDMAFTLMIGVIVGAYSSIYVACPTVLFCQWCHQKFAKAKTGK